MPNTIQFICNKRLVCGEGPVWVPNSKKLYWTDSESKSIYCYDSNDLDWEVHSNLFHASSLALHANGGLVIGNKTGFHYMNQNRGMQTISNECENRPITGINDIIADSMGRIYGGQECFESERNYETGFLYRIDLNGNATVIEEGLHISNGMGFSPDLTTFYLTDTIPRHIYAYDFNALNGAISNKKIFVTLDRGEGLPDGLTVDSEGYVWVARFLGNGLTRYDPEGKIERRIDLPFAQPTSLTFGGKDYNEIYITSASMYWKTDLAPKHHDYAIPRGGELICIRQEVVGKPEYPAKIQIE